MILFLHLTVNNYIKHYSILYYAAGTWLNTGLHEKLLCRLKVLSNATLRIVFNKKRQDIRTNELHSLANMLSPAQMALHSPGCLLQKVLALKTPSNLYDLASVQVSYKERTNSTIVTKDWTSSIGLSRFPNNAHDAIKLVTGDISQDKIQTFKNKLFVSIHEKSKWRKQEVKIDTFISDRVVITSDVLIFWFFLLIFFLEISALLNFHVHFMFTCRQNGINKRYNTIQCPKINV